jgi:hypothetical protein
MQSGHSGSIRHGHPVIEVFIKADHNAHLPSDNAERLGASISGAVARGRCVV